MKQIKKVKIFYNSNEQCQTVYKSVKDKLIAGGFEIVEKGCELGIAIGGDGSFIRMLKESGYSENIVYVGINVGTLGFLQEVEINEVDLLINSLKSGDYSVHKTGIQNTIIKTKEEIFEYNSFNEIIIRRADLSLAKLDIKIEEAEVERFVGDALLICTSVGSTAHGLSYGGAVVHDSLHTIQLVPIGVFNSVINRSLKNPLIVPDNIEVNIAPLIKSDQLIISIDGENYDFNNVEKITTKVCSKKIERLRLYDRNFFKKLNSKFIKS